MAGLNHSAAFVGMAVLAPTKAPPPESEIELMAELTRMALDDAGMEKSDIDGIIAVPPAETPMLFPSLLAE
mgnify:CR=1 FL=1